jgi:hypothetical protein
MAHKEVKDAAARESPEVGLPVVRSFRYLGRKEKLARVRELIESTPPLKTLLEGHEDAWGRRKVNVEKQSVFRSNLSKSHGAYLRVLTTARSRLEEGGNVNAAELRRDVNKAMGLSLINPTVSRWLNGFPPMFMAKQVSESVAVIPSTEEDPDFAFFCCFTSAQKGSLPSSRLTASNEDQGVIAILRVEAKRLLGKTPGVEDLNPAFRSSEGLYSFTVECPKVLDYLRAASDGEVGLAWGHVKSMDERIEGARGFLAANSSVGDRGREKAYPIIRMSKMFPNLPEGEEPRLFVDMQILLSKLGIVSTLYEYKKGEMWFLGIAGLNSLMKVKQLRLLPEQKHRRLEMFFERRGEETIRSFTQEQYDEAMRYKKVHDRLKAGKRVKGWSTDGFYAKVARKVNDAMNQGNGGNSAVTDEVDFDNVKRWLAEGQMPQSVQEAEKLKAIGEKEKRLYGSVDDVLRGSVPKKKVG